MMLKGRGIVSAVLILVSSAAAMLWIYQVDPAICNGCGNCIPYCTEGALRMEGANAVIDPNLCTGCGDCVPPCIRGAIYKFWYTGISEDDIEPGISLWPNPTAGYLLVTGADASSVIEVFDLSGRLALSSSVTSEGEVLLDLSDLASGLYRVQTGNGNFRMISLIR